MAVTGGRRVDLAGGFVGATAFVYPGEGAPRFTNPNNDAFHSNGLVFQALEDSPVNRVPGPQTVVKDTPRTFSAAGGNPISVVAPETGSSLRVSLSVTHGTLTLASKAGLTFQAGTGLADPVMVFTGSPTAVNAALDGLQFRPSSGFLGQSSLEMASGIASGATAIVGPDTDNVPIAVVPGTCSPRPRVAVQPAPGGGKLQVTITPTELNGGTANTVSQVQFRRLDNASVVVNGQAVASGQTLPFAPGASQVSFTVQRVTAGQPMTALLTVVDGCGSWPTFVGAGTGAPGV